MTYAATAGGKSPGRRNRGPFENCPVLRAVNAAPREMFLGLVVTHPTLGEHSLIPVVLWVGFCGQFSHVHKEDWQAPSNCGLGYPQARPGAKSLVAMADSGGKSFTFSTPKVRYSHTVSNTVHRESPLSRWPSRHSLFWPFPCNCENWGEGRNTCDTHCS